MAKAAASATDAMHGLLCYCRQGFESDLAAELGERAAAAGVPGYARAERDAGHVRFITADAGDAAALARALPFRDLVFARQKLRLLAELRGLDPKDRLGPLLAALPPGLRLGEAWVEHPDTDAGKPLSALARSFGNALRPALRKAGVLAAGSDPHLPRLHVCFLAGDHALLALADPRDSAPWPLGIPRLKLHPDAPSRSALKLEEAFLVLLDAAEREQLLRPGMSAADLGAAPGGWTWVLGKLGAQVTAIDKAPLARHVAAMPNVRWQQGSAFALEPRDFERVDWLCSDVICYPSRLLKLVERWLASGKLRHAICTLKFQGETDHETARAFAAIPGSRLMHLHHNKHELTWLWQQPS